MSAPMIPLSMLNFHTSGPRERMLRDVVATLTRLWQATKNGTTWGDLLEYAEVCAIPGWHDDATRVLLTVLGEASAPKDVNDLTYRAPVALATTIRRFGPDNEPQGKRVYLKGDLHESKDAALSALDLFLNEVVHGWAEDPRFAWRTVLYEISDSVYHEPINRLVMTKVVDHYKRDPVSAIEVLTYANSWRDSLAAETTKPPGTTVSAPLERVIPTGVRFGPHLDTDNHTETFDADLQVAADVRDVFLVTAPEQAAHPPKVWLPRPDGAGGHTFDVATAAERGTTKRVPVRFRPRTMFVGGQPVDIASADLRFTFTPQRFVNDRTGELIMIGNVVFETMRPFRVDVDPQSMRCGPIVDRALLKFKVDMLALSSGTSVADVRWRFSYKLKDQFGAKEKSATGRIAIRCPDGKVLGYDGKTSQYFAL
ncbi:hypothetical protein [Amycolatopsis sp. H20-H5]|uniref:hypothetical protein n=1 Tax=Amycolatopsis sp. H20-H5 TaxID=3046309 RepID=UPI002DBCFDDD|nr:hypothetical protein [Amycolatopsis sp. H20-H5]MEC3978740.1 hypothetical protein [Amycolatopsis sp. H20-H5]